MTRFDQNINARYAELGFNTSIPDFESYVQAFKDFTFDPKAEISYPETGDYGLNILSDAVTSIPKKNMDYQVI